MMKNRCLNIKAKDWEYYGGRGITLCKRWYDFRKFAEDMGPRLKADVSLDRIDNEKGYYPANCRWASKQVQMNNRRRYLKTHCKKGHEFTKSNSYFPLSNSRRICRKCAAILHRKWRLKSKTE